MAHPRPAPASIASVAAPFHRPGRLHQQAGLSQHRQHNRQQPPPG
ncbi:MAG: hypothetical protein ACK5ZV_08805 [bacterium]